MAVNSSSTSSVMDCNKYTINSSIILTNSLLRLAVILPFSALVLYLGHRQWRQQRSFKTASHSDIFTYHMAVMELIWSFGGICGLGALYSDNSTLKNFGSYARSIPFYGRIFFHLLTCVERYLAVVHPITYLGLRNARGVKIRNISIGCAWVLSVGLMGVVVLFMSNDATIQMLCILVLSITIISFCSISVLCVLIRPGPGEGDREKKRVDQSKRRAFYTITVISSVLWLWFIGLIVYFTVANSPFLSTPVKCVVKTSVDWLNLPSGLVLPLLYLHRARKLPFFKKTIDEFELNEKNTACFNV